MPWIPKPTDRTDLPRAYHWSDDAACSGADTEAFFQPAGRSIKAALDTVDAKSYCTGCPVREECLEHALVHGEEGVWGGLDDNERKALIRRRRREAKLQAAQAEAGEEKADAPAAA